MAIEHEISLKYDGYLLSSLLIYLRFTQSCGNDQGTRKVAQVKLKWWVLIKKNCKEMAYFFLAFLLKVTVFFLKNGKWIGSREKATDVICHSHMIHSIFHLSPPVRICMTDKYTTNFCFQESYKKMMRLLRILWRLEHSAYTTTHAYLTIMWCELLGNLPSSSLLSLLAKT